MKSAFVLLSFWLCFALAQAQQPSATATPANADSDSQAENAFRQLTERYFSEAYYKFNPTEGTSVGFHQYDIFLEDYSKKAITERVTALKKYLSLFEQVDPNALSPLSQADRELVLSSIHGQLLELEDIRGWEKNPDNYSSIIANSAFTIMSRKFLPVDRRLHSLVKREQAMPQLLREARSNLKHPPKVYTEVALEQLPDIISFFQKDVPAAFADAKDAETRKDFEKSNAAVVAALQEYQKFLQKDLLKASDGDFRIGAENFRKKLLYNEMVDTPLDQLLAVGMDNLHKNQDAFKKLAAEIDSTKTPQQVLEELELDHPTPDKLLDTFRSTFTGLREFIEKKHIVTIPSRVMPILEETPPFERALTTASMDTPGPYERVATEAYFNVTLPDPNWKPEQIEDYMRGFNRGTIISTSVHEALPGHYIQFLWLASAPTKVRKLIGCSSNAEGWAHYTEQMMLDEGYGDPGVGAKDKRESQMLRLGQLQDALLRNARFIVGIKMHTGQMTFDEGVDFFEKEGFQTHATALKETKRGTSDPTYLVYTLGKLQILKLREDYKAMKGSQFNLEEFHNAFLKQGFPPIKIVRRALLGNDSPAL